MTNEITLPQPTDDASDDLAEDLTRQHLIALRSLSPDDVVQGTMTAALNVALETLPYAEVSAWLRRLADTIDAFDPAEHGRAN